MVLVWVVGIGEYKCKLFFFFIFLVFMCFLVLFFFIRYSILFFRFFLGGLGVLLYDGFKIVLRGRKRRLLG